MARRKKDKAPDVDLDKEKAEGSRETVNQALENEAGRHPADYGRREDRPGITNRPLGEEKKEQSELPPRGDRKPGAHAA